MEFLKINDVDLDSKTVLVRADLNSPLGRNGEILDNLRIKSHAKTIKELSDLGAKVVVMAHQGRPGDDEFVPLKNHAPALEKHVGKPVEYVDDIFGSHAREHIIKLGRGDIILLENVRFSSEEVDKKLKNHSKTHLISSLSPLIDYYVNDAFAVSHRAQVSLMGFPEVVPAMAGRVMERELTVLNKAQKNPDKPCLLVLGGVKLEDAINVMKKMLKEYTADKVLTTGALSLLFLSARGYSMGKPTDEFLAKIKANDMLDDARELLSKYGNRIELPVDVAVEIDNKRFEVGIEDLPVNYSVFDIGSQTIGNYKELIEKSRTVIGNGPAGKFEQEGFDKGTRELLKAMCNGTFSIIGGGHLALAAEQMELMDKIPHVSTGGGAFMLFMAGEELPGVTALLKGSSKPVEIGIKAK